MYSHVMKKPPANPDKTRYDVFTFRWSDTEYTPRELERLLGRRMPYLVMTTQGYLGRDEYMNAVASDEMYWLREVAKQPRVVVRSESDGYFSIPLNYPQKVLPTTSQNIYTNDQPMTIKELVAAGHKSFMFEAENSRSTRTGQSVYNGPNESSKINFGRVEIIDQYDEKYLVGHTLPGGNLYHEACVIPLYMPITLVIAAGVAHRDYTHFYKTMLAMNSYIDSVPPEMRYPRQLRETSDILMYEGKPEEGEYDCLEPLKYLSLTKGQADNTHQYAALPNDENPYVLENAYATAAELITPPQDSPVAKEKKSKKPKLKIPKFGRGKMNKEKSIDKDLDEEEDFDEFDTDFAIDNRGGARGPDTNIASRVISGYHVNDLNPQDILAELSHVLETGKIPEESQVFLDTLSDVENDDEITPKKVWPSQQPPEHVPIEPKRRTINKSDPLPDLPPKDYKERKDSIVDEQGNPPWNVKLKPTKLPPSNKEPEMSSEPKNRTNSVAVHKKIPPAVPPKNTQMQPDNDYTPAPLVDELTRSLRQLRPVQKGEMTGNKNKIPTKPSVDQATAEVESAPSRPERQRSVQTISANPPPSSQTNHPVDFVPSDHANHSRGSIAYGLTEVGPVNDSAEDDSSLDVANLSRQELGDWLVKLNLAKYRGKFESEQIDGSLLLELDVDTLISDFSFRKIEAIRLMKFAKGGWKPD